MHHRSFAFLAALAVPAFASGASGAPLHSSAFLTYQLRGEETVATYGENLEKISVFAFHVTSDGDVVPPTPWVPDAAERLAADPGGRTILVTANNRVIGADGRPSEVHSGAAVHAILADPAKRSEHIRQLAEISNLAHGIELNYENLLPETRDLFTQFVRELRLALPLGKQLSLVLQAKTDNRIGDRGRAVDWRAVEPFADHMRIMAYYYSWSTSAHGPVVSLEQLRRLADYALNDPEQGIPRHKLSIILSFWGWDWPMPVGTKGRLVQYAEAMEIARSRGVTPLRDPVEKSLHFDYVAADGIAHEVWIDDAESLQARIELLRSAGVPRIDFWHLATGDERIWQHIAANAERCGVGGPLVTALPMTEAPCLP